MSDEIEKLKMHSPDLTAQNVERIAALFPGCVTESRGPDGTLRRAVDFDLLRQELSDSIVAGPQVRFHFACRGQPQARTPATPPTCETRPPSGGAPGGAGVGRGGARVRFRRPGPRLPAVPPAFRHDPRRGHGAGPLRPRPPFVGGRRRAVAAGVSRLAAQSLSENAHGTNHQRGGKQACKRSAGLAPTMRWRASGTLSFAYLGCEQAPGFSPGLFNGRVSACGPGKRPRRPRRHR